MHGEPIGTYTQDRNSRCLESRFMVLLVPQTELSNVNRTSTVNMPRSGLSKGLNMTETYRLLWSSFLIREFDPYARAMLLSLLVNLYNRLKHQSQSRSHLTF